MTPLPRAVTRPFAVLVLLCWAGAIAALVAQSYSQSQSASLATDLARYGSAASWRGVYYRGEKVGFTVSQTVPTDEGFRFEETGRLQMSLLGATTAATLTNTAHVDRNFALQAFEFSLDPGTGAIEVRGRVDGRRLILGVTTPGGGTRTEERELNEPPALAQTLPRRLASGGLVPGTRHQWTLFDPATLRNSPITITVRAREVVRGGTSPLPAFRLEMEFAGLRTTAWITDTGEIIREESPLGLITVRESPERARAMAVSDRMRVDLLEASSVVPKTTKPIGDPLGVVSMRLRLQGVDLAAAGVDALSGGTQRLTGDIVELRDPATLSVERDTDTARFLTPEPLIESDASEIIAEANTAVRGVSGNRARAERLTRYVNALLEKKPTISVPSAREVLRTKVGDCNEHTALYVAMARALGMPARIAVGMVYIHGAFYYHAWPEVYLVDSDDGGVWLPVDPTLNQYPADTTHLRLTRGGLDKQVAILPLIGRIEMTVLDVEMAANADPVLVGREPIDLGTLAVPVPQRQRRCCFCPDPRR